MGVGAGPLWSADMTLQQLPSPLFFPCFPPPSMASSPKLFPAAVSPWEASYHALLLRAALLHTCQGLDKAPEPQDSPLDLSSSGDRSSSSEDEHPTPIKTQNSKEEKRAKARLSKKTIPCPHCGKMFDRPSLLERHVRTHTGERPYSCDFCNKTFSTSSSLNTHRRIHTGERPHKCETCGKSFTASSNLYYHRMTHVKDKPHPYHSCLKSFSTPGDLRSHQKTHARTQ